MKVTEAVEDEEGEAEEGELVEEEEGEISDIYWTGNRKMEIKHLHLHQPRQLQ